MDSNTKSFAAKCFSVVAAILVLRVSWIALNVFGVHIAVFIVVTALITALAMIFAPIPTSARLKQVVASFRSIFS